MGVCGTGPALALGIARWSAATALTGPGAHLCAVLAAERLHSVSHSMLAITAQHAITELTLVQ
jgi:hypothetical protein